VEAVGHTLRQLHLQQQQATASSRSGISEKAPGSTHSPTCVQTICCKLTSSKTASSRSGTL
jgi:hypothetical protein